MLRISILYIDSVLFNSVYYVKSSRLPFKIHFLHGFESFLFGHLLHFLVPIFSFSYVSVATCLLDDRLLWSRQCRQFANIRSLLLEKRDMLETGRAAEQHVGSG